jgi:hypothetical protein
MRGTGRREDTCGHPDGVAVLPQGVYEGLAAFKKILVKAGAQLAADHEHTAHLTFRCWSPGRPTAAGPYVIQVDLAIHETGRVKVLSKARPVDVQKEVRTPWCAQLTFYDHGYPAIAEVDPAWDAARTCYALIRTLVNEWREHLPGVPFPCVGKVTLPGGAKFLLGAAGLPPYPGNSEGAFTEPGEAMSASFSQKTTRVFDDTKMLDWLEVTGVEDIGYYGANFSDQGKLRDFIANHPKFQAWLK